MSTSRTSLFEDKPRWAGAPLICEYENLPALVTWADAAKFHEENNPGASFIEKWLCAVCSHYHYVATPAAPAGMTSGSAREPFTVIPRYLKEVL